MIGQITHNVTCEDAQQAINDLVVAAAISTSPEDRPKAFEKVLAFLHAMTVALPSKNCTAASSSRTNL